MTETEQIETPKLSVVVLAAGLSQRMGPENKLLALVDGKPMIACVIENIPRDLFAEIIVVTGHKSEQIETALRGQKVRFVFNTAFESGMASSLKCGLEQVDESACGVLVVLGDMPLVPGQVVVDLVAAFNQSSDICAPMFGKNRGNPVLWGRDYFDALQSVTGDRGGRDLLMKFLLKLKLIEVKSEGVLKDFDTKQSLSNL